MAKINEQLSEFFAAPGIWTADNLHIPFGRRLKDQLLPWEVFHQHQD